MKKTKITVPISPEAMQVLVNTNPMANIAYQHVMLSAGIVPINSTDTNVNRDLQNLVPAEARVLKRKFRKLWRSAAKTLEATKKGTAAAREEAALTSVPKTPEGKQLHPTRGNSMARKRLVFMTLRSQIQNVLDQMTQPPDEKKELTLMIHFARDPPLRNYLVN